MAWRTIANQIGVIVGPALGGVLLAVSPASVYAVAIVGLVISIVCTLGIEIAVPVRDGTAAGLEHLLGGISFLRRSNVVLGAILLDLFAVLFGGAVALLPAFARDVLHVGPIGLGALRSAPALGALVAATLLARRPNTTQAGKRLLMWVGIFGLSILVFGASRWFALSIVALVVSGFADTFNMNIRSTAVALATPNELRGRVSAVENVFISASNQLGAFESGAAAALLGTVPSVILGGAATVVIAGLWVRLFPSLAELDDLQSIQPTSK
jgi:MFS family permease